jgi:hypothetical protein
MYNKLVSWLAILPGIVLILIVAGCSNTANQSTTIAASNTSPPPTVALNPVQQWADPITETYLQGLSENDMAEYAQYSTKEMKNAVTADILAASAKSIQAQYGQYQNLQFLSTETQSQYTIVHYKVNFTKGSLKVRMVFTSDHLIAGQWFE